MREKGKEKKGGHRWRDGTERKEKEENGHSLAEHVTLSLSLFSVAIFVGRKATVSSSLSKRPPAPPPNDSLLFLFLLHFPQQVKLTLGEMGWMERWRVINRGERRVKVSLGYVSPSTCQPN